MVEWIRQLLRSWHELRHYDQYRVPPPNVRCSRGRRCRDGDYW